MYYIISLNSKGEYNMKFGYFDDANREYVITTPKTPLPWDVYKRQSYNLIRLLSV